MGGVQKGEEIKLATLHDTSQAHKGCAHVYMPLRRSRRKEYSSLTLVCIDSSQLECMISLTADDEGTQEAILNRKHPEDIKEPGDR